MVYLILTYQELILADIFLHPEANNGNVVINAKVISGLRVGGI